MVNPERRFLLREFLLQCCHLLILLEARGLLAGDLVFRPVLHLAFLRTVVSVEAVEARVTSRPTAERAVGKRLHGAG